ncbi:conjugative transposon protein TraM [Flagellimonas onchidii]|uniref:conjugative transposon protein TraM n=1 Tax=Flagellimonas onchidii TaxID=2562684 RepID=UPI0010A5AF64|nr:conjugative transposon protein TraM [Allomuricauda onchidii]
MKIDKKKTTFAVVIGAVLIFIIAYSVMTFGDNDSPEDELLQPLVPTLEAGQEQYSSRLDAVNDLKEIRQTNAPSIYDEKLLDSTGLFDPDLIEKEKARLVDSIYNNGKINYSIGEYRNNVKDSIVNAITQKQKKQKEVKDIALKEQKPIVELEIKTKEIGLQQQLFFASNPLPDTKTESPLNIRVTTDIKKVIKANDRLEMRTLDDVVIGDKFIPKNTPLFGIVSFKPNRVLLKIENIDGHPVSFKACDIRDGLDGIYIENSFREELKRQLVGDAIDDINVPGVPQVRGIKKIFQRSNRLVKSTVYKNYKLILKVDNRQ